jgi:hypothetical protein
MTPLCHRDGVTGQRGRRLPDGALGIAGVLIVCAAGTTLVIEAGLSTTPRLIVALTVAVVASIVVKVGADMRTAGLVKAIADGDIDAGAAPGAIQARLASKRHRDLLARALRRVADDARRYPWQGRLAAPPIVLHFQPATCQRLLQLADILQSPAAVEPRGVAVVEDLVTNPASPLFGSSDDEVETEVSRALFLLRVN